MITLITGVPGSGKTAAAVDLIVKEYKDRPLYVDGLDGLKIEHETIDVLDWPGNVPDGALVVVDEVQRRWRPRGVGSKVPPSVAALETHRHHGLDFIIITQSPKLVDSNVRGLVGRHVHIRDTGFLGRWAYEWPETNIDLTYRSCQNKRRYVLPRKVFDLYKSASMHVKPIRKLPPMVYMAGLFLVCLVVLGAFAYRSYGKLSAPSVAAAAPAAPAFPSLSASPDSVPPVVQSITLGPPDERVDFVPRLGGRPWTAPAYDAVRVVVRMPHVAGAICSGERCVCVSDAGERLDLSDSQCREWLDLARFNPYREPPKPAAAVPVGTGAVNSRSIESETAPVRGSSAVSVPFPSGYSNPRAEAVEAEYRPLQRLSLSGPSKDARPAIAPRLPMSAWREQ